MNDLELNQILKRVQPPPRSHDYWADFPGRVIRQLNRPPGRPLPESRPRPRLVWAGAAGLFCLLMGFALGHWWTRPRNGREAAFLQNGKMIREVLATFPNQVRAILQDESGLSLVLSDRADVPPSPPLWVRFCHAGRCATLVTFSGQEVQVGGQKFTVLSTPANAVLLVGDHFVWSSVDQGLNLDDFQIQAHPLTLAVK
jgi:hypothetical protein